MQHEKEILCRYRLERAKEDLEAARVNHSSGLFKAAINRSYYAIFHSIRAVNILDGFDASKHSSVIRNNKMWYSAPCNFNDVFDCNIAIDEQKIFYEALKLFPDKRGIRPVVKHGKIFGQQ